MGIIKNAFENIDPAAKQRVKEMTNQIDYGYAIDHLQREKDAIDKALSDTKKWNDHKESWKRQKSKSNQIGRAIKKLTS